jgi:hypothetical protein
MAIVAGEVAEDALDEAVMGPAEDIDAPTLLATLVQGVHGHMAILTNENRMKRRWWGQETGGQWGKPVGAPVSLPTPSLAEPNHGAYWHDTSNHTSESSANFREP